MEESMLLKSKNIFVTTSLNLDETISNRLNYIENNFCGLIQKQLDQLESEAIIYLTGDITAIINSINLENKIFVVKEFSINYENISRYTLISSDEVPINIYGVGVYFSNLFDDLDDNHISETQIFESINNEHEFQFLTESNKPGVSYRKGIYLSEVTKTSIEGAGESHFNLLRCSTNLDGPTENFRDIDRRIIHKLNQTSKHFFSQPAQFNHVLAQIYENVRVGEKLKKAKIGEHSDKTKDMPENGLMAFCTFYKEDLTEAKKNKYSYNGVSLLTRLHFNLKNPNLHPDMAESFDVLLEPNSVFMMSLFTNRLYTHTIKPSVLDLLPTRMGYVVRCSKTEAVYKNGQTYIKCNNGVETSKMMLPLHTITTDDTKELKALYSKENSSEEVIEYGITLFSMNNGDYMEPNI
eukprot:gene13488-18098_t